MRTFTILGDTSLSGEYTIYDSEKEYYEHEQGKIKIWGKDEDLVVGDWVRALDGYIVQLLKVKRLAREHDELIKYTFANGTFTRYKYKDKPYKWQNFYGQYTVKRDLQGVSSRKVTLTRSKKTILIDILKNNKDISLIEAVKLAGISFKNSNEKIFFNKLGKLLMDKEINAIISERSKNFLTKLQTDEFFSDENIVKYIKEFMVHVRKGSLVHLNSIMPLLELLGKIEPKDDARLKKTKAIDTPYEEVPPPQIP